MILLIEALALIAPLLITLILYFIYYQIFIIGYVMRTKRALEKGDYNKAIVMKKIAIKKQPIRMELLYRKYNIKI